MKQKIEKGGNMKSVHFYACILGLAYAIPVVCDKAPINFTILNGTAYPIALEFQGINGIRECRDLAPKNADGTVTYHRKCAIPTSIPAGKSVLWTLPYGVSSGMSGGHKSTSYSNTIPTSVRVTIPAVQEPIFTNGKVTGVKVTRPAFSADSTVVNTKENTTFAIMCDPKLIFHGDVQAIYGLRISKWIY